MQVSASLAETDFGSKSAQQYTLQGSMMSMIQMYHVTDADVVTCMCASMQPVGPAHTLHMSAQACIARSTQASDVTPCDIT